MSDLEGYFECHQDDAAQKGFMTCPRNLKEARKEIREKIASSKKKKPVSETFAIEIGRDFAGFVELHRLNEKHHEHRAVVGYCIHKNYRNQGIATMAVKLLTKYGFKKYKLARIEGTCRTSNKASARVLEKAGFHLEGILRKNKKKNGKFLDDMVWAKIR